VSALPRTLGAPKVVSKVQPKPLRWHRSALRRLTFELTGPRRQAP
jgi:hypothetical protein